MEAEPIKSLVETENPASKELNMLLVESALEWIALHTSLNPDSSAPAALPAGVRLFIQKYVELMSMGAGVVGESIQGLSQSFSSASKSAVLEEYAQALLGKWLLPDVRFVAAVSRY